LASLRGWQLLDTYEWLAPLELEYSPDGGFYYSPQVLMQEGPDGTPVEVLHLVAARGRLNICIGGQRVEHVALAAD
jgi:hypothetical protein